MPGHSRLSEDFDEYRCSRTSAGPVSEEIWPDDDDLLAVPDFNVLAEQGADPMFPSPHKFNLMVQDYLRNLSPKKREKALLTQKMYDAVLAVLQDPKDTGNKTAQFRFWAKKMFQLTCYSGEMVICHDCKPVAVKEQIYEVLCHCHGQAGHGGRDKTSAQVRRYYSWIPKEIIARFVRDCPFCQSRRTQSSSGFGNMSDSQAFLISLQSSGDQSAGKRSISLAQARANAAQLGHKPYRKPSIRTIDACRSRRGSAMSDDYVHYDDGSMPPSIQLPGQCPPGYENFYQMPVPTSVPRRSNSYHEPNALHIQLHPHQNMYRRASESSMYMDPNGQYLAVPNAPQLSRGSTSRASVDSLSDIRHFAQQLRLQPDRNQHVKGERPHPESPVDIEHQMIMNDHRSMPYDSTSILYDASAYDSMTYGQADVMYAGYQFDAVSMHDGSHDGASSLSTAVSPTSGTIQGWQPNSTSDLVKDIFDSNNVFAIGEAAGMTQEQVMAMHDSDPSVLQDLHSHLVQDEHHGVGQFPHSRETSYQPEAGTSYQAVAGTSYQAEAETSYQPPTTGDESHFPADEETYHAFLATFDAPQNVDNDEEQVEIKLERLDHDLNNASTMLHSVGPSPTNPGPVELQHDYSQWDEYAMA